MILDHITTNAFGDAVFSPLELIRDATVTTLLQAAVTGILRELGLDPNAVHFVNQMIWAARPDSSLPAFEAEVQHAIGTFVQAGLLRDSLDRRAHLVASQIRPYLRGNTVADIGCGDGMVSFYLGEKAKYPILVDVQNYIDARASRMPFHSYNDGDLLPIEQTVDTALLLTVMHHSADPMSLFRAVKAITTKRIVVIESVFGVRGRAATLFSPLGDPIGKEDQRKYASFVDWFYNRVLHTGVPVFYNYCTPAKWLSIFRHESCRVLHRVNLGIDQKLVPEYHILFVLEPIP